MTTDAESEADADDTYEQFVEHVQRYHYVGDAGASSSGTRR